MSDMEPSVSAQVIADGIAEVVQRLCSTATAPSCVVGLHGLAVDSKGDIYVGEVSYTNWPSSRPGQPIPKLVRSLQKLEKVQ